MIRVLYPINIDRWRHAPATVLREIAQRNSENEVYSFSSPQTAEDASLGHKFWELNHVTRLHRYDLLVRRFDIVHRASSTRGNGLAVVLAKLRSRGRCREVFTLGAEVHPNTSELAVLKHVVPHADVLIATSKAVYQSAEEHLGRRANGIIFNGVDTVLFDPLRASPDTLARYGIRRPFVLFAGTLCFGKRPDLFLELAGIMPHVSFVIVGRPGPAHESDQIISAIQLHGNVTYLGQLQRKEVRDLMAYAVALVFPSESEGLPLVPVEASAMGLPVLAQPKSALPEVVKDGINGWLLPEEPTEQWAAKIETIMAWSLEHRLSFRRRARAIAMTQFSWDAIAAQYAAVYQELGRSGHSRARVSH